MASPRTPYDALSVPDRVRLLVDNERLRQQLRDRHRLADLAGSTRAIRHVCELMLQVAPSTRCVWIRGETGVGKSRVARGIHLASPRSAGAFVTMNCASMLESEVDVQLCGPAGEAPSDGGGRGAIGRARGGTLFFDEVGALGPLGQRRLLHLARDREWERTDRSRLRLDLRVVAASSRRLDDAVLAGTFRRDLWEYLDAQAIDIPPLRERKADLPVLVDLFVEEFARDHIRGVNRVSARAMDMLMAYEWPRNVGQLRESIERAVILATGPIIHHHHLATEIQETGGGTSAPTPGLGEALHAYERELLQDALRRAGGVRSRAARLLMTSERVFNYRLRKHRIDSRRFKAS